MSMNTVAPVKFSSRGSVSGFDDFPANRRRTRYGTNAINSILTRLPAGHASSDYSTKQQRGGWVALFLLLAKEAGGALSRDGDDASPHTDATLVKRRFISQPTSSSALLYSIDRLIEKRFERIRQC
eukprot:Opistho-2@30475